LPLQLGISSNRYNPIRIIVQPAFKLRQHTFCQNKRRYCEL